MVTATDDDFETALEEDLGWRRVELAHLKRSLDEAARRSDDGPATRGLSRAMVAMCYAHWEGYSKGALQRYAQLVSRRKPRLSEAGDGLALEHVERLVRRSEAGDTTARMLLLRAVRGQSDDRINLEKAQLADTRANLRYATLSNLFTRGCIPLGPFELKANLIDVLLRDRRNGVAHGKAIFVPPAESIQLCDDVIHLLETVRDVLSVQVRSKRYLFSEPA